MSAKKTTITVLAALLGLSWMAAPSATAQLMEPATGWVPGQPYVITVSDPDLVAVAVVYVGRIPPLSTGERVRLFLPNLDRSGLVYAVSTLDDNEVRRPGDAPRRVARKPREVAGRVHSVVIPSPANPALGQASTTVLVIDARAITSHLEGGGPGGRTSSSQPGGVVDVQDGLLDAQPWSGRRTLDGGRPRGEGVDAIPDPHGAARRMLRPPEPGAMRRLADGVGTLGTARDVLGGTGDRATTYDTGGPGVQEATAGSDPCFKAVAEPRQREPDVGGRRARHRARGDAADARRRASRG